MEVYLSIAGRTILFYIFILFIFRIMGKREIGELSVLDLVVFIMIGELAVASIIEPAKHWLETALPMFFFNDYTIYVSCDFIKK